MRADKHRKAATDRKATLDEAVRRGGEKTNDGKRKTPPFPEPALDYTLASDIETRPIRWLWEERIPRGMISIFVGEAGQGKSLLLVELTAIVTRPLPRFTDPVWMMYFPGKKFPEGGRMAQPGRVVILSAEDHLESVVKPRLIAAGADLKRVVLLRGTRLPDLADLKAKPRLTGFSLKRDLEELEKLIRKWGDVALVIVDPITSYLDRVDTNAVGEVRNALLSTQAMVAKRNIAFVMLSHFNKTGYKTLNGIMGSQAFGAVPRAVYKAVADQHEEGLRYFLPDRKNNLVDTAEATALAYRVRTAFVDPRDDTVTGTGPDPEESAEKWEARKRWAKERGYVKTACVVWDGVFPLAEAEQKAGLTEQDRDAPRQEEVEKLLAEAAEITPGFEGYTATEIVQKLKWERMANPWKIFYRLVEKGRLEKQGMGKEARYKLAPSRETGSGAESEPVEENVEEKK
jgi:hypothetical protein